MTMELKKNENKRMAFCEQTVYNVGLYRYLCGNLTEKNFARRNWKLKIEASKGYNPSIINSMSV